MEKVRFIIQAREGSERFPKKCFSKINGKNVIDWVIDAVKGSKYYDDNICILCPEQDKGLTEYIKLKGYEVAHDRDRNLWKGFLDANLHYRGHVIVRITGDSPLIQPEEIDKNIEKVLEGYEYAANEITVFGNACEAFTWEAMTSYVPTTDAEKEHATTAIRNGSKHKWIPSLMTDYAESIKWIEEYVND